VPLTGNWWFIVIKMYYQRCVVYLKGGSITANTEAFFFLQDSKEEWLLISAGKSRAVGQIQDDLLHAFKRKKIYNTQMRLLLRWFKREPEPQSLPVVVILKLCGW